MKLQVSEDGAIVLSEVYVGIGINTDQGLFGIAQRDSGIEVMLNGKLIWSSTTLPDPMGLSERVDAALNELSLSIGPAVLVANATILLRGDS